MPLPLISRGWKLDRPEGSEIIGADQTPVPPLADLTRRREVDEKILADYELLDGVGVSDQHLHLAAWRSLGPDLVRAFLLVHRKSVTVAAEKPGFARTDVPRSST